MTDTTKHRRRKWRSLRFPELRLGRVLSMAECSKRIGYRKRVVNGFVRYVHPTLPTCTCLEATLAMTDTPAPQHDFLRVIA